MQHRTLIPSIALALFSSSCASHAGVSAVAPAEIGGSSDSDPANVGARGEDPELKHARQLFDDARTARDAQDPAVSRARAAEAIDVLLAPSVIDEDKASIALLAELGAFARDVGELRAAERALKRVLEVRSRTLSDDEPALQKARMDLAITLFTLGDLQSARDLLEKVVEVRSRTLPSDAYDLQAARANLANVLRTLGDLPAARELQRAVVDVLSRTLPQDDPHLQKARANLAATLGTLGDLPAARALFEKVLDVCSRTLPDDHPDLQAARGNLAVVLWRLGDVAAARTLFETTLEVYARTLPQDHPVLLTAQQNLAATLFTLGDVAAARTLQERVLAVDSRAFPDDHPELQAARNNLAATLKSLGDLASARALQEKVLEVASRTLPEDHPDLQSARVNLAGTLYAVGDLGEARTLQEKALEVYSRTLPDDHYDLQVARQSLACTLWTLGDLQAARSLFETVLEVRSRTLPDDHPELQAARQSLGVALRTLGDLTTARELEEKVLETLSHALSDEHPELQRARGNLAETLIAQCTAGDEGQHGAQGRDEEIREFERVAHDYARALGSAARMAARAPSGREAEERCVALRDDLSNAIMLGHVTGIVPADHDLDRAIFLASERTRGAAYLSAALTSRARTDSRYEPLRQEVQRASAELARLAEAGTNTAEYAAARSERESAERKLVELSSTLVGGADQFLDGDVEALSGTLGEHDALIGYRQYTRLAPEGPGSTDRRRTEFLGAFVLRTKDRLEWVELGPIAPIAEAVERWRQAIGAQSDADHVTSVGPGSSEFHPAIATADRGVGVGRSLAADDLRAADEIRRLVFDPLLPVLDGVAHVIVATDGVVNLVPLDALPARGVDLHAEAPLGDRWRIETRTTLLETLLKQEPPRARALVGFGNSAYDREPVNVAAGSASAGRTVEAEVRAVNVDDSADTSSEAPIVDSRAKPGASNARGHSIVVLRSPEEAGALRGSPWERGFAALPATRGEVRTIGEYFVKGFGEPQDALVLEGAEASRESLFALAPRVRFLHLATHGWFAPESVRSWTDREPIDLKLGLGERLSGREQVRGMNPMVLCGLALAGANLPAGSTGRVPGVVTAEELSTLDLSNCELAVLSACDTNVGERRAGQGVASLQQALQMAGARSVITSLWKVPDETTKDLMLDFYRRLWVEKKPKWQALWEAKMKIRNEKDESGRPKHSTRDWAAWVLTGEPQ